MRAPVSCYPVNASRIAAGIPVHASEAKGCRFESCRGYSTFAESYYRKEGEPTGEVGCIKAALRRPSPASIWRWCRRGTSRAGKLPALTIYGQWHSTREALLDWLRRGSERPDPPADDVPAERSEATTRLLMKHGLLDDRQPSFK